MPENNSSTPTPAPPEPSTSWWLALLKTFLGLSSSERRQLFERTFVISAAIFIVLVLALYVGTRFLGLRIVGGQVFLGSAASVAGAHATVDAVGGFQNSHVWMKKGDRLVLEPEGRVHLAADQAYNFARAAKPLILHYLPNHPWPEAMKRRYPMPKFDETTVFYRGWAGPDGESYESDLLADCKLRRDLNWGTLLATVMPNAVSSSQDPLEILSTNSMTVSELVAVPGRTELTANRDGWLTFIINDAVISPYSQSKDSRDFYDAVRTGAEDLSQDSRYRVPLETLPLVFYSDNLGAFRITITPSQ
jgi:hypothetical protein